ncbi:MAG: YfiR/HmsC family protein [Myxococcaceae bacterium]
MRLLRLITLVTLLCAGLARAQEAAPAQISLLVMLKVITYDTGFAGRGDGDFVVVIPYLPTQAQALTDASDAVKAMAQSKIQSRALRFVPVPFDQVGKAIAEQKASAVLLLPGSSDAEVAAAASAAKDGKLYSLSLEPAFVQNKVALGVVNKDGRPQVLINLNVTRELGISFPTSVLKIARTYQ